jgi:hypothetical protein
VTFPLRTAPAATFRRGATLRRRRALGGSLLLAAAVAMTAGPAGLARGEAGRIEAAQSADELKKRADLLMKGVVDAGGTVTFGAIEAGASPEALIMKDIVITTAEGKRMTIEVIEIRAFDWANGEEPRHVDMTMRKLVVAADALERDGEDLRNLGLSALTLSAEMTYRFDEKERAFDVGKIFIDLHELGELRLRLKLTGITPADLKAASEPPKPKEGAPPKQGDRDDRAVMGLMTRLNLAAAAIAFKDKSLVERLIRADAKKKNLTEPAAKAKVLEELAEERGKAEDDVTKELLGAAIKFVTTPGEIELAANPPAPVNVMAAFMMIMSNRASFKQMLGLSISVK